jgi:hypothetical protein
MRLIERIQQSLRQVANGLAQSRDGSAESLGFIRIDDPQQLGYENFQSDEIGDLRIGEHALLDQPRGEDERIPVGIQNLERDIDERFEQRRYIRGGRDKKTQGFRDFLEVQILFVHFLSPHRIRRVLLSQTGGVYVMGEVVVTVVAVALDSRLFPGAR